MKSVLLAALALLPATAFAVDGVVLINQASVTGAGGFPFTISQPGSYKLSGNLVVPAGANGIIIVASNVTLDLAGFSITTPGTGGAPDTLGITTGAALSTAVTIKGGAIRGFTNPIEPLADTQFWQVEELVLEGALAGGSASMDMGTYTRIWHVTGRSVNFNVGCPSVVAESIAVAISISPGNPGSGGCAFTGNATLH